MKKIFFLLFALCFLAVKPVLATDLNIDCPAPPTTCSKSGTDPLFSNVDDGHWYPGRILAKTINLKNSSLEKREMAIKGERTPPESILEDVMHISIVGGVTVIWSGSAADFYNQDKIGMGIFDPGADFDYDFTVLMAVGADDNYQNQETVFDLTLGFWGEPILTPTATPTPGEAGDGEGAVLGAGVSAPVCTDTKPGLPTNFTATAGPGAGEVSLTWTAPAPPYTYFLIAYSDSSDSPKWGNPNVGNVTSYIVSGLGGGTYWFWLRAGNGCMPGDFAGPVEPVAVTGIPEAPVVAPGFLPEVLGEATPSAELEEELSGAGATEEGEVAGVETKPFNFWWLLLLLIIPFGFYLYFRRR